MYMLVFVTLFYADYGEYSEPSQTFKKNFFVQPLPIFAKSSIFHVRVDSEYIWLDKIRNLCVFY